jgi:hypothetical protein
MKFFFVSFLVSTVCLAWEGPPPMVGGGLVNLVHPSSYLDFFATGSDPALNLPWDVRLRGNFLLSEDETQSLQANFKLDSMQFPQSIPLGSSGITTPMNLQDIDFGAIYNKKINENEDWGIIGSLGSDSDMPFNSYRELDVNITLTYHKKQDALHSWFFLLNEANNRSFLPWVPVPGIGYFVIYPQAHVQAFYGIPFFFGFQPAKEWNLTVSYFLLTMLNAEVDYKIDHGRLYGSFQWSPQTWLRAGRSDTIAHIIFETKKLTLGWQIDLPGSLYLNIGGGFAFDQRVAEAESILSSGITYSYLPAGGFGQVEIAHKF